MYFQSFLAMNFYHFLFRQCKSSVLHAVVFLRSLGPIRCSQSMATIRPPFQIGWFLPCPGHERCHSSLCSFSLCSFSSHFSHAFHQTFPVFPIPNSSWKDLWHWFFWSLYLALAIDSAESQNNFSCMSWRISTPEKRQFVASQTSSTELCTWWMLNKLNLLCLYFDDPRICLDPKRKCS